MTEKKQNKPDSEHDVWHVFDACQASSGMPVFVTISQPIEMAKPVFLVEIIDLSAKAE
ncbi:hypothetical protein [Desulfonatronum thioautotrophicum]|uniref:hypothetical protein n=1 Tax=Desulfonatronum thioautotrophicum TaxID=617001 RepID=UPI0012947D96|nr:hypothetical protein [Desulfonatronum thioautotrophicum]